MTLMWNWYSFTTIISKCWYQYVWKMKDFILYLAIIWLTLLSQWFTYKIINRLQCKMCRNVYYGDWNYHFQLSVWMYLSIYIGQLQCFSLWYFFICWLTVWWKHNFCKCGKRKQSLQLIAVNIMLLQTAFNFFLSSEIYFKKCCTNST